MSEGPAGPGADASPASGTARRSRWRGRSELLVAGLVLVIAGYIAVRTAAMPVPPGTQPPGPRFFPTLVAIFMAGTGVALAFQVLRRPARAPGARAEAGDGAAQDVHAGMRVDWRTVGIVVGSLTVFILLLQPVGWLLSAAFVFYGVSYAMGSRRLLFDAVLSLVFSSVIQLAFVAGLGLSLPSGILGGIL
ncbi:tripartite tricarboxylate transporter TctB family protein [Nocardiopsis sp. NPDC050513]|uniref:tripartite tricarboxylate transporter TctB family protein n=1 Tax=Nocardiopsis sp. NPDC050513 TaxID=3364338 RepID=UPI00379DE074